MCWGDSRFEFPRWAPVSVKLSSGPGDPGFGVIEAPFSMPPHRFVCHSSLLSPHDAIYLHAINRGRSRQLLTEAAQGFGAPSSKTPAEDYFRLPYGTTVSRSIDPTCPGRGEALRFALAPSTHLFFFSTRATHALDHHPGREFLAWVEALPARDAG